MFKYIIYFIQRILVFLRIRQIQKTILVLGIDNSGKTTFLMRLGMDYYNFTNKRPPPNQEVYVRQNHSKIKFIRPDRYYRTRFTQKSMKQWFEESDGSVLFVDGTDHERLPESKQLIQEILQLTKNPVLIFYNKCDRKEFVSVEKIDECLNMQHIKLICNQKKIPIKAQVCSLVKRLGITEGLQWIYKEVGVH